jgi:hypothetical protein
METNHYRKIAETLLEEDKPLTIEKLAVIVNLPLKEIETVLMYFSSQGFLKHGEDFKKILLSDKAKGK